ncbi:hypothetical protein BKI51_12245 [Alphaproteobacteria bacterium AO1-B]|nr:hypothetical protein BKI51_12245 [Alphaproteobacteria bacterium AO1-B]
MTRISQIENVNGQIAPISLETLAELKAVGYRISGHCKNHYCGASRTLDLDALIERLGPEYVVINETRIPRNFLCQNPACEHHQKGIRGGGLILQPPT